MIGWVFDVAAAHRVLTAGEIIDHRSGVANVPGFAAATNLTALTGRYRVIRSPFDLGNGYFGVELGALGPNDQVSSIFLINRLFRLPVLLQQPAGVATDIATNGAMLFGWQTNAVRDANAAATTALGDAEKLAVPLLTAGQSQAGGVAQLQAAYMAATYPTRRVATGFITLNAAYVVSSVRRLGVALDRIEGINFSNDLDPGFGPHGLLPNKVGLQVYVHPNGSGSRVAGSETIYAAWLRPDQHLLSSFNKVSLSRILANLLSSDSGCAAATRVKT